MPFIDRTECHSIVEWPARTRKGSPLMRASLHSLSSFALTRGLAAGIVTGMALSMATPALAAPSLIVNGSFEADALLAPGTWSVYSSLSGWTGDPGANGGIELRRQNAGTAQDGQHFVELDTYRNSWMTQQVATDAGQHYTLSYYYSPRAGVATASNPIEVYWNGVQLALNGGNGVGQGNHQWQQFSFDVIGTGGLDTLRFAATGTSDGYGGSLDNIALVAAVPEPGMLALSLAALGALGMAGRRRTPR